MTIPLTRYFLCVGGTLLAALTLTNFLLDPATGAKVMTVAPKPVAAVRHDQHASRIERLRNEQWAWQAAEFDQPQQIAFAEPVAPVAVDAKAKSRSAVPASPRALKVVPASLASDLSAREIAPPSAVKTRKVSKSERVRKTRTAHHRAKARQIFADGRRQRFANPHRRFQYRAEASAGQYRWNNRW